MAEYGAHLTGPAGSLDKPSIFEVLAQESLASGLRSAGRYLAKILAESRPATFAVIFQYFEEIYTLLDIAVQYSHLKSYGASFAENFYGLKRVPAKLEENGLPSSSTAWKLPPRAFIKSLLFLVGEPYLKQKMNSLYLKLKDKQLDGSLESLRTNEKQLAKAYLKIYPLMHLVWEGCAFYYQLLYAVGRKEYHSPQLQLASVKLALLTEDDLISFKKSAHVMLQWQKARWSKLPAQAIWVLTRGIAAGLGTGLSVGAFFLQFLEWWYSQEGTPASFAPLPCPPPPPKMQPEMRAGKCPLCLSKCRNDTALATSGFVFCYKCILEYVRKYHKCPVTGYPSNEDHLIRIYHNQV